MIKREELRAKQSEIKEEIKLVKEEKLIKKIYKRENKLK